MTTLAARIKQARKHAGLTQKALAETIGVSQPVISQLENGENQQSVHLLRIASACRVNAVWLSEGKGVMTDRSLLSAFNDYVNSEPTALEQREESPAFLPDADSRQLSGQKIEADPRFIVIPRFDMAASMGPGIVVPEHLEVIQQLVVDREWIREQRLLHTGIPNLAIITGFGDSMLGTFSDGDPLMVDRGVNSMDKDGIYVFSVDGAAHIKRLQRIGGSRVKVISDNPTYDRWEADLADISIHARVLIGLNVRKME